MTIDVKDIEEYLNKLRNELDIKIATSNTGSNSIRDIINLQNAYKESEKLNNFIDQVHDMIKKLTGGES